MIVQPYSQASAFFFEAGYAASAGLGVGETVYHRPGRNILSVKCNFVHTTPGLEVRQLQNRIHGLKLHGHGFWRHRLTL